MCLSFLSLCFSVCSFCFFFFFNDTATTEIYTLSLHDALPISASSSWPVPGSPNMTTPRVSGRSEEHTSELQSHLNLVCRLLLEKKKKIKTEETTRTNDCRGTRNLAADTSA